ncbi:MAG: SET domain-containing protein-lysine N-methyltransferase [Flavitalea sp.]
MILPCLYITSTKKMGKGVFTSQPIKANTVIEVSPVIVMEDTERKLLDQTLLHDYIFEWGENRRQCCMALGYVPLYNHSFNSNCEYEMEYESEIISVKTIRAIEKGEEVFINYNGTFNNKTPLWFDAK